MSDHKTVAVTYTQSVADRGVAKTFSNLEELFDALAEVPHQVLPDADKFEEVFRQSKISGRGIIPATFRRGHKSHAALLEDSAAHYLAFDLDTLPGIDTPEGKAHLKRLLKTMRQWEGVAWTTARSGPQGVKLRWLVALDRPLPNADRRHWETVYKAAADALNIEDEYDENAADSVRLSFLPQCQGRWQDYAKTWRFRGRALDTTALAASGAVASALAGARADVHTRTQRNLREAASAASLLENTVRKLRPARPGERNASLNAAVYRLAARYAHVLELKEVSARVGVVCEGWHAKSGDFPPEEAVRTIEHAYRDGEVYNSEYRQSWQGRLSLSQNGTPKGDTANIATTLACHDQWCGVIQMNERCHKVYMTSPPPWEEDKDYEYPRLWSDYETTRLLEWLRDNMAMTAASQNAYEAVLGVAGAQGYDPFRDWLDALEWDGEPRLDGFFVRHAGVDDSIYAEQVFAKWMISAVARTYRPGCKVDHTLILEGAQGARKSTFWAELAGHSDYFRDGWIDVTTRDGLMSLQGPVIIEFAELQNLTNREVETIKAFLTTTHDHYRPPYGRAEVLRARRCVFAGSTNETSYLKDATGGRRFWPVTVDELPVSVVRRQRTQLWAEAVSRFEAGEKWWFGEEAEAAAEQEQDARRVRHPWEDALAEFLADGEQLMRFHEGGRWEPGQYSVAEGELRWLLNNQALVAVGASHTSRHSDVVQMSRVLSALGWRGRKSMHGRVRKTRHFAPKFSSKSGRNRLDNILGYHHTKPGPKKQKKRKT